jgi:hypothetical protein
MPTLMRWLRSVVIVMDSMIFLKKTLAGLLGLGAILHTFVMPARFFLTIFLWVLHSQ